MSTRKSESAEPTPGNIRVFRELFSAVIMHGHATAGAVGMHPSDLYALNIAAMYGPITSGELARRTGLSTGAATRLIDRLEAAGHVRRVADPTDRRRVLVEIVNEHEIDETLEKVLEPLARRIDALLGRHTNDELEVVLEFVSGTTSALLDATREIDQTGHTRKGSGP